ncbi:MAG: fatty acid kinase, partial [Actinomycetota bacterium]|nr:fatty acid kinase [Actinomycetota bacterium]
MIDGQDPLDGANLKQIFSTYRDVLDEHRDFLNSVNVYPVADGDTGTNMLVTIRAALDAAAHTEDLAGVASKLAHGAVMGGRGNSGIILSQIVKGMMEIVAAAPSVGPGEFVEGLDRARSLAYDAVADPVEGTILSAVSAAASGARVALNESPSLTEVVDAAHRAANDAVTATTGQLEQLTRAGVVDGGAKGFAL